jgi:AcrR family transcriptional regulator
MKTITKISGEQRRTAIIKAATGVFVEKGFDRTTTRELAAAAGISEALLFKHFPNKEALYSAILACSFDAEESKITKRLSAVKPSTSGLVSVLYETLTDLLSDRPGEREQTFVRLVLRSLLDEGEFTRQALQGPPLQFTRLAGECIKAARASGDIVETPVRPNLSSWLVHHLIIGLLIHSLPTDAVIDYRVPSKELINQVVWFCLRGMGFKDEAIRRSLKELGRKAT